MPAPPSPTPVLRAVFLGASNLKRGLPALYGAFRRAAPGPVEVLAACGHGRSYVGWSRIGWGVRALPGIAPGDAPGSPDGAGCGLWRALERLGPLPTVALLTDVGNDLLYGPPVDAILAGVALCIDRLQELGAAVVCTPLRVPTESLVALARTLNVKSMMQRLAKAGGTISELGLIGTTFQALNWPPMAWN